MLFNSYAFLFVFLPLVLLLWHLAVTRLGDVAGRVALLAASVFFYGCGGPRFLLLLGASVAINYLAGHLLQRSREPSFPRRLLLCLGLAWNLGTLGCFKYGRFFVASLDGWFGFDWPLPSVLLPLGISFYTFVQVAYLVDAYRGTAGKYGLLDYSLFVTFFPHLVAGPIVHHARLLPQFGERGREGVAAGPMAEGITLFTVGLAKKLLVADNLSAGVGRVFGAVGAGTPVAVGDAWLGVVLYAFQIYFDFSGYSDMAIGLARLFDLRFPCNFRSPYAAVSLGDFWRRWHITLSTFIRDYFYIPLGGSRRGLARTCFNLVLVMTVAGLWHGANWTFVAWGAAHGVGLMVNHLWRARRTSGEKAPSARWVSELCWAGTFLFVVLAWVLFRADSLGTAGRYYGAMLGLGPESAADPLLKTRYWFHALLLLLAVRLLPNSWEWLFHQTPDRWLPRWTERWRWRAVPGWAWTVALLFAACALSLSNVSEFLYWQF